MIKFLMLHSSEAKCAWESALSCIEALIIQDQLRSKYWKRRHEKVVELSVTDK